MSNCLQCGNETDNPKFCSRSCGAIFNNSKYPKRKRKYYNCINCGDDLKKLSQRKFCSDKCSADYYSKLIIEKWLSGEFSGASKENPHFLSKTIRTYLIEQSGNKCVRCGWGEINPYSGILSLEVDHIDGDCTHNRPENLQVLCPNCHSLTPFHGALNIGYDRGRRVVERRLGKIK